MSFLPSLSRRAFLRHSAAASLCGHFSTALATASPQLPQGEGVPFSLDALKQHAQELAAAPPRDIDPTLPPTLDHLTYDQYRSIRFHPDHALWKDDGRFSAQFFHRGFYYRDAVRVYTVVRGEAREVLYDPLAFDFGRSAVDPAQLPPSLGFAGFRLHTHLNSKAYADELVAFLGASYFRALGRGMRYGLSARGLAINTASDFGEEFPIFRSFYLERPTSSKSIVIHALLDSASVTGVYSFTIRPGDDTVMHIEATLYPRRDLGEFGLAPLTSMFLFGPQDRAGVDDFRNAVHDSDGLMMLNGGGEWLWRPLVNPERLRISAFVDRNPRGFGLMQRDRDFSNYQDLEARYETRPSAWVEPLGEWGEGSVILVEIPTDRETNDNMIAYWKPAVPLSAGQPFNFAYQLHWCTQAPSPGAPAMPHPARVVATRVGRGGNPADEKDTGTRKFTIDFEGRQLPLKADAAVKAVVSANAGAVSDVIAVYNDVARGWRIYFDLEPDNANVVELRAYLAAADKALSETWLFQWTP